MFIRLIYCAIPRTVSGARATRITLVNERAQVRRARDTWKLLIVAGAERNWRFAGFWIAKEFKDAGPSMYTALFYALNYNAICAVVFTRDGNLRGQSRVSVVTSQTRGVVK